MANRIILQLPHSPRQIELDGDNFTWPDHGDTISFYRRAEGNGAKYKPSSTHIAYELDEGDRVIDCQVFMALEEVDG